MRQISRLKLGPWLAPVLVDGVRVTIEARDAPWRAVKLLVEQRLGSGQGQLLVHWWHWCTDSK